MKTKFRITAIYDSGLSQTAEFYHTRALEAVVHLTVMQDMRGVKKVVIERVEKEGETDD